MVFSEQKLCVKCPSTGEGPESGEPIICASCRSRGKVTRACHGGGAVVVKKSRGPGNINKSKSIYV